MAEEMTADALVLIAERIAPGATLARSWPLRGGISAKMTALELVVQGAETRRVIVRQPGDWAVRENPRAAAQEYRVLHLVRGLGVAAPAPLLLDESNAIVSQPYLVVEFIDGQVVHSPPDLTAFTAQMAAAMAQIHRIDGARPELAALPRQDTWMAGARRERPDEVDEPFGPRRIRAALRATWPLPHPNPPALLHGDPWPGNLLWHEGRLVAMIDWEEAHTGDPLEDLAIARFDVLSMLGGAAMEQLTAAYAAVQPQVDLTDLPCWDLYAALRPVYSMAQWADGWSDLGRPDITEAVMRAAHREFVAHAFSRLSA